MQSTASQESTGIHSRSAPTRTGSTGRASARKSPGLLNQDSGRSGDASPSRRDHPKPRFPPPEPPPRLPPPEKPRDPPPRLPNEPLLRREPPPLLDPNPSKALPAELRMSARLSLFDWRLRAALSLQPCKLPKSGRPMPPPPLPPDEPP